MHIPLRIRLLHNFGRSSFIMGFLFALIGLSFVIFFSFQINWRILVADTDDFADTSAIITAIEETSYTVNENSLFEYSYTYFTGGGNEFSGSFLEFEGSYGMGEEVSIHYLKNFPDTSRISGKDRRNFDRIMFLAGLGGLIIGIIFIYPSVKKTHKERKVLISGRPARAKLVHAEPTNLNINEQTVYNLTYEYSSGNNKSQEFSLRSHMIRNLAEDQYETIIYDPRNPSSPVLIDTLPGTVARYVTSVLERELSN